MLKPKLFKAIAAGLFAAAGVLAAIGGTAGAGKPFTLHNIWFEMALLALLIGLLLAAWASLDRGGNGSGKDRFVTQKFIEIGQGSSLGQAQISGNLQISNIVKSARFKKKRKKMSVESRAALVGKGNKLVEDLFEFGRAIRKKEPTFTFPPPNLTPEEQRNAWQADHIKHDQLRKDTQSEYEIRYVGRIGQFLDEAQEVGIEITGSLPHTYQHMVGPDPIQEVAKQISIITGKIERLGK